MTKHQHKKH